jgi:hypothetical protein
VIQSSARLSLIKRFFLTVEHFFLPGQLFLAIFSLSRVVAFLSSETNCSRFVSFVSRKRQFFSFFRRSSIRCFQTKIKTTGALCALFLSLFSRITPMNAQKVEQQYTIVSSSREAAVCVRVRERVREQRVHDLIQLF